MIAGPTSRSNGIACRCRPLCTSQSPVPAPIKVAKRRSPTPVPLSTARGAASSVKHTATASTTRSSGRISVNGNSELTPTPVAHFHGYESACKTPVGW